MNAIKFGIGVTALSFGGVLLSYGIGQGLIFLFKMFGWLGFAFWFCVLCGLICGVCQAKYDAVVNTQEDE